MKNKNTLLSLLFSLGGGLLGLAWYRLFGCPEGVCLITSSPLITAIYVGILGWLIGGLFLNEA